MKRDKLVNRLLREITASPKKATILGLLLLVAVWFWTPLVWKWLSPKSTGSTETASAEEAPQEGAKPVALDATDDEPKVEKHSWKEIGKWIGSDPRMTAAAEPPGRQHPFDQMEPPESEPLAGDEEEQKAQELAATLAQATPDPESLGLVLSSTIVGPHSSVALINGRSYQPGATIQLDHEGKPIEFQLAEIRNESIVLKRKKEQYEVRLPEPKTSGILEITVLPDH